jgi:hypothetical protein
MTGEDSMRRLIGRSGRRSWITLALAVLACLFLFGGTAIAFSGDDTPTLRPGAQPKEGDESAEQRLLQLDLATTSNRLAGDNPLDISQAGALRAQAANAARKLTKNAPGPGPSTFTGTWSSLGPNPVVTAARTDSAFYALSGRIGALAIEPSGRFILGGAQGGIWTMDPPAAPATPADGTWVPRTSDQDTQTVGDRPVEPLDRVRRDRRRGPVRRQHVRRRDSQVDGRRDPLEPRLRRLLRRRLDLETGRRPDERESRVRGRPAWTRR